MQNRYFEMCEKHRKLYCQKSSLKDWVSLQQRCHLLHTLCYCISKCPLCYALTWTDCFHFPDNILKTFWFNLYQLNYFFSDTNKCWRFFFFFKILIFKNLCFREKLGLTLRKGWISNILSVKYPCHLLGDYRLVPRVGQQWIPAGMSRCRQGEGEGRDDHLLPHQWPPR